MTQAEQNKIIGIIEDLTVWEARVREWRGELTAILQKEELPRRKRTKKPSSIEEGIMARYARKMARERKQFSI